jgi:hypothetical protein
MSFPEGPPTGEPQRYATDGRDAEGTTPTAEPEDSTTAALAAEDPSDGTTESDAAAGDGERESVRSNANAADWDEADRNTAVQEDGRGQRASKPGGALGPGTTATGGGTSLD